MLTFRNNNHLFSFICVIIFLFIIIVSPSESKHHVGTHSCPVTRRCPTHHSHKICGSDGHLYPSHCHLRKAACERGLPTLRAVHPDQCVSEEDDDPDEDEGLAPILGKETNNEDLRQQQQRSPTNQEASSSSSSNFVDSDQSSCGPKEYDSMKEAILQKVNNDISLLFSQLDDNGDGSLSINELWKKSGVFKFSQDNNESPCLITDLLQHEDKNGNDVLNYSEFQAAFAHLFTITMVTLDQNLAVNNIQAHVGDNVEIRCDIVGRPTPPPIVWTRWGVNLATINVPNLKVFSDGSLYLTDVQLSLSGNYTCQAEGSNSAIKQVHILSIIVPPVV